MTSQPNIRPPPLPIEWAVAGRAIPGELESGDLHFVTPFAEGVLLAVIDGLGHGPDAADAARTAATALSQEPHGSVTSLMQRCHEALRRTRGVVLNLASIDAEASRMTWLGVGNVDGALYRADRRIRESIPQRSGVVGYELPSLRATQLAIGRGDTLIFVTDGISSDFSSGLPLDWHPQEIADDVLRRCAKATDDALVLVARYLGGTA